MRASAANETWLITGIPGAGKSTMSRQLASRMERAVHIDGDRLQEWIVRGSVWPEKEPNEEADRQIRLNIKNQCLLARSFSDAGFVPVMDRVVVNKELLEMYQNYLAGYAVYLVVLAPTVEVALRRDAMRSEKTVAARWEHLDGEIREGLKDTGLWVDSSELSVDETVDRILNLKAQALLG